VTTCFHLAYGDEYLAGAKARELVNSLTGGNRDPLGLEIVDGKCDTSEQAIESLASCREAVGTLGFLGGEKVVWFQNVNYLSDNEVGKVAAVKASLARLTDMLKSGLAPGVHLVISAGKVDKRGTFYRFLRDQGETHEFAVADKPWQAQERAAAVADEAFRQAGLTVKPDARAVFVDRVGSDSRQIVNEVGKLGVYLGRRRAATREDVEAITSFGRDAVIWEVQDAFGRRDLAGTLAVVRRLLFQRESAMGIMIMLENRIRDLVVYREALDHRWLQLGPGNRAAWTMAEGSPEAKAFEGALGQGGRKMHPYRLWILASQAANYKGSELRRLQTTALAAHRQLVTTSVPAELIIEFFIIQALASRPSRATRV
jgi:DNA polymerase-3 subunit delta